MVQIGPEQADGDNVKAIRALLEEAFPDERWHDPHHAGDRDLWHLNSSALKNSLHARHFVAISVEYLGAHRADAVAQVKEWNLVARVRKAGKARRVLVMERGLREEAVQR